MKESLNQGSSSVEKLSSGPTFFQRLSLLFNEIKEIFSKKLEDILSSLGIFAKKDSSEYTSFSISSQEDIEKVKKDLSSIIDFSDTTIHFQIGDRITYHANTGIIRIYRQEETLEYRANIDTGKIPGLPYSPMQEKDTVSNNTQASRAVQLANFVTNHAPHKGGVISILRSFGIAVNNSQKETQWDQILTHENFEKFSISHPDEAKSGAIIVYKKGNEQFAEIKGSDDMYYSSYASRTPRFEDGTNMEIFAYYPKNKNNHIIQKQQKEKSDNQNFIAHKVDILKQKGLQPGQKAIVVSSQKQKAYLVDYEGHIISSYPVSTGKNGTGNEANSGKTSTGTLIISQKIGEGYPKMTRFVGLKPQGIVPQATEDTSNDFLTSRVLVLEGLDSNNKNARSRAIYMHGTNEELLIGTPASHGCIRFLNDDIISLTHALPVGTMIHIE